VRMGLRSRPILNRLSEAGRMSSTPRPPGRFQPLTT
jgi:hypothetical protein